MAPTPVGPTSKKEAPSDAVSLSLLRKKGEDYTKQPLVRHYDPELDAAFYFQPLSGDDMETAQKFGGDSYAEVSKYMIMLACKAPEIGQIEYNDLNKNSPGIKARLLNAIRNASGLGEDVLETAKNPFGRAAGDSSDGTDSPENSDTAQ